MNQPCTEQAIRDNEQLAELEAMYEQTERARVLIGDRMREIKNRLQNKPPVDHRETIKIMDSLCLFTEPMTRELHTKLAGGKYEK